MARRRVCTSRCYYAKSKKCTCVCGGANHGTLSPGEEIPKQKLNLELAFTYPEKPVAKEPDNNLETIL